MYIYLSIVITVMQNNNNNTAIGQAVWRIGEWMVKNNDDTNNNQIINTLMCEHFTTLFFLCSHYCNSKFHMCYSIKIL